MERFHRGSGSVVHERHFRDTDNTCFQRIGKRSGTVVFLRFGFSFNRILNSLSKDRVLVSKVWIKTGFRVCLLLFVVSLMIQRNKSERSHTIEHYIIPKSFSNKLLLKKNGAHWKKPLAATSKLVIVELDKQPAHGRTGV